MTSRILITAALLIAGFVAITSRTPWGKTRLMQAVSSGQSWTGPAVTHSAGLGADELNNIDIYKTAHLATVNITSTTYRRTIFMEVVPSQDLGSGFLISQDGRILTNNHVIQDANRIEVTLPDQTRYRATLLNRDPLNDLALIQIQPKKQLPILRLGDSDTLQVGQKVLAIGNPFGLDGSLTVGVVSSLGRTIKGENDTELEGLIQTDAAINRGNSGGPLLDSQGNVQGINTAILGQNGNIGIGFAMPINRAKLMLEDFQAGRKPPRLGFGAIYVAGDYAEALDLPVQGGLLIQTLERNGPAARAGLRGGRQDVLIGNTQISIGGDFIVAIDGKPVDRSDAIARSLQRKRAGDSIELTIFRSGQTTNVRIKLVDTKGEAL